MEGQLEKTPEGQGRLNRAKDRLDTKVAEIGQAAIDRANDEQKIDKAQDDTVEGLVPETVITTLMENEDDVAELFGDFDDAPELQRGPQRFELSPRGSIPKRRAEDDEKEENKDVSELRLDNEKSA